MKYSDCGVVISIKKYGEKSAILKVFSKERGVCRGFVKFLNSKKNANIFQIGNIISFDHNARIEDSLGTFTNFDLIENNCSKFIFNKLRTNCAKSIISIVDNYFLEKEPFHFLYTKFENFLNNLGLFSYHDSQIIAEFIKLELIILECLGYGVDFSCCVVTNSRVNLAFVSPKSAHAVSREAGEKFAHKLLRLPEFLIDESSNAFDDSQLIDGLNLSGFFLKKYLFIEQDPSQNALSNNFSNNFYRENILKIIKN